MKNAVFWDIKTPFVPYKKHTTSPEHSQLMLCHIWVFMAVTMKNARLLGYNPVRTSQETHYFSNTETSRLMLCKI
jgi:hypothetical protein